MFVILLVAFVMSVVSVVTEYTVPSAACQALFTWSSFWTSPPSGSS